MNWEGGGGGGSLLSPYHPSSSRASLIIRTYFSASILFVLYFCILESSTSFYSD